MPKRLPRAERKRLNRETWGELATLRRAEWQEWQRHRAALAATTPPQPPGSSAWDDLVKNFDAAMAAEQKAKG